MHFDPNIISEFEEGERGERGGRGGSLGSGRRAGTAGNIRQGVIVNSTISPTVTKRNTNSACNGGSKRKTINRQWLYSTWYGCNTIVLHMIIVLIKVIAMTGKECINGG